MRTFESTSGHPWGIPPKNSAFNKRSKNTKTIQATTGFAILKLRLPSLIAVSASVEATGEYMTLLISFKLIIPPAANERIFPSTC
ncbi:hypothetical protein EBR21_15470, partial [bacterium]|nr:hypothetical protein [bacterium]